MAVADAQNDKTAVVHDIVPQSALVRRITCEGRDQTLTVETLFNLHAAPQQTSLGRLAAVLSRMDSLSHILLGLYLYPCGPHRRDVSLHFAHTCTHTHTYA